MVTAKPVRTDFGECGGAQHVLLHSPGLSTGRELHWHLGRAVWPTEASVASWRRSDGEVAATVWEAAEMTLT
jgi:hypothetical protein